MSKNIFDVNEWQETSQGFVFTFIPEQYERIVALAGKLISLLNLKHEDCEVFTQIPESGHYEYVIWLKSVRREQLESALQALAQPCADRFSRPESWPALQEGDAKSFIEHCKQHKFYLSDFYIEDLRDFPIVAFGVKHYILRLKFSRLLTPAEIWTLATYAASDNDLSRCIGTATEVVLWFD